MNKISKILLQLRRITTRVLRFRKKDGMIHPHRSFKRTYRRDYKRTLKLPGYVAFAAEVAKLLWGNKRLFGKFLLLYLIVSAITLGILPQASYQNIVDAVQQTSDVNPAGAALLLVGTAITGKLTPELTSVQQVYSVLLILFGWLTIVWLLRQRLAGRAVKVRDGLYSAGSPIFATLIVASIILIQLIPAGLAAYGYSALIGGGIITEGIEAMIFFGVAALLVILSAYLIAGSLLSLVIITLPGMYPGAALRSAADIVSGRRLRLLLRLVWLLVSVLIAWVVILVPFVLLGNVVNIAWLPIVPLVVLILSAVTLLWASSYIYMLYRRLVDE